jgi:anti-sigma factor RsiW
MAAMHEWTEMLSEYVDSGLEPASRQALEAHLAACDDCRATVADLQHVVRHAAALPERQPPRDLWAGIAERIAADRTMQSPARHVAGRAIAPGRIGRVFRFTASQLAVAASALILVTATAVWLLAARSGGAPAPVAEAEAPGLRFASTGVDASGVVLTAAVVQARYAEPIAALEQALAEARGHLDPETIAVVEQSLATVDTALEEARAALEADPGSRFLSRHFENTMQRKVELLRSASRLPLRT